METENIKCQICEGKFKKELIVKKPGLELLSKMYRLDKSKV